VGRGGNKGGAGRRQAVEGRGRAGGSTIGQAEVFPQAALTHIAIKTSKRVGGKGLQTLSGCAFAAAIKTNLAAFMLLLLRSRITGIKNIADNDGGGANVVTVVINAHAIGNVIAAVPFQLKALRQIGLLIAEGGNNLPKVAEAREKRRSDSGIVARVVDITSNGILAIANGSAGALAAQPSRSKVGII